MAHKIVKLIEAESGIMAASGWGEGEMKSFCSVGIKFQSCKRKRDLLCNIAFMVNTALYVLYIFVEAMCFLSQ